MRNEINEGQVTWIDIHSPSREDVLYLAERFQFHPVILEEILPPSWRIKLETFDTYLYLVFSYPVYNKIQKETRPQEVDVLLTKEAVITSHYHSLVPLKALFDSCNLYEEKRKEILGKGSGMLLYAILEELGKSCLVKLNRIDKKLEQIEREILSGREKDMLREISLAKADIVDFLKIVLPQQKVFETLRNNVPALLGKDLAPFFSRVAGTWEQATIHLGACKETIGALESMNNSLLSYKTSETLRMLTLFSGVVFPLTLFATLFSMRTVSTPFIGYKGDFFVILLLMALIAFGVLRYFKKKSWL